MIKSEVRITKTRNLKTTKIFMFFFVVYLFGYFVHTFVIS